MAQYSTGRFHSHSTQCAYLTGEMVGESIHALDEAIARLGVFDFVIDALVAFVGRVDIQEQTAQTFRSDIRAVFSLAS